MRRPVGHVCGWGRQAELPEESSVKMKSLLGKLWQHVRRHVRSGALVAIPQEFLLSEDPRFWDNLGGSERLPETSEGVVLAFCHGNVDPGEGIRRPAANLQVGLDLGNGARELVTEPEGEIAHIQRYFRSTDVDLADSSKLTLSFLESSTSVPMMLAHITYDSAMDNDGAATARPSTYSDNQLMVDAITSNFPDQYKDCTYLPQDPGSVYYRAVNSGMLLRERDSAGAMINVHPLIVPADVHLGTHGACYGLVAFVGEQDDLPSNFTGIIDSICTEIRWGSAPPLKPAEHRQHR
eukprot:gene11431-13509_t